MPLQIIALTPDFAVSPQLATTDFAALAQQGFKTIINNRPDGEQPDQPDSAAIEAAATAVGLAYCHIPIVPGQMTQADVAAMAAALAELPKPALIFLDALREHLLGRDNVQVYL